MKKKRWLLFVRLPSWLRPMPKSATSLLRCSSEVRGKSGLGFRHAECTCFCSVSQKEASRVKDIGNSSEDYEKFRDTLVSFTLCAETANLIPVAYLYLLVQTKKEVIPYSEQAVRQFTKRTIENVKTRSAPLLSITSWSTSDRAAFRQFSPARSCAQSAISCWDSRVKERNPLWAWLLLVLFNSPSKQSSL